MEARNAKSVDEEVLAIGVPSGSSRASVGAGGQMPLVSLGSPPVRGVRSPQMVTSGPAMGPFPTRALPGGSPKITGRKYRAIPTISSAITTVKPVEPRGRPAGAVRRVLRSLARCGPTGAGHGVSTRRLRVLGRPACRSARHHKQSSSSPPPSCPARSPGRRPSPHEHRVGRSTRIISTCSCMIPRTVCF